MPTKRKRISQPRRAWQMSDLDINDVIALQLGWEPGDSMLTSFRTAEDFKACWAACKEHFLDVMQTWDGHESSAAHRPGERPWAWWHLDHGRPMPRYQPPVLRRLGLLTAAEEEEMRHWDKEVREIGYRNLRDFYSHEDEGGEEEDA